MRAEIRWAVVAAALAIGVGCAQPYGRCTAPFYAAVARAIARGHPWEVTGVAVTPGRTRLSAELQLEAWVRRHREDQQPAARVIGRVQVGAVVETPLLFWTLLLLWPARSARQRAMRCLLAVPAWLTLECMTTACQLMLPMAQASAILAGNPNPITLWDRWCQFLEAGGQFVVSCCGAIAMVAADEAFPWFRRLSSAGHRAVVK